MQFISGGPDVPEELIRAHQEGKVIFFCGAGISRNADLPLFEELVDKIFACCGVNKSKSEQDCCEKKQYDTVLDLLERRFDSGRKGVREKLWEILNIRKTLSDNKLATHKALLALARDENNVLRLVTTNYDRLFHIAFKRENKSAFEFNTYQAPFLPIPKKSRWNGLVFLHGLLPSKKEKVKELNRLVLTSGDFGLAYLNERWASRFISELFENYIVCFVGYSINDPVLRYMMDAISADRLMGEKTNEVWAFAVKNKKKDCDEWKDKGATPIYCDNYDKLHETIQEWARVYSDGVEGKSAMIIRYAHQAPQKSTKEDNYVNKVLWAISDPDGGPAETFSKLNPSPSLDWLFEVFSQTTLVAEQLINLGLLPFQEIEKEKEKKFSLIYRIPPYDKSTPMALVLRKEHLNPVDPVMIHLGEWLCHHLGEARLLLWFAAQGDYR